MLKDRMLKEEMFEVVVIDHHDTIPFRTHLHSLDDVIRTCESNERIEDREVIAYKLVPIYWTGKEEADAKNE